MPSRWPAAQVSSGAGRRGSTEESKSPVLGLTGATRILNRSSPNLVDVLQSPRRRDPTVPIKIPTVGFLPGSRSAKYGFSGDGLLPAGNSGTTAARTTQGASLRCQEDIGQVHGPFKLKSLKVLTSSLKYKMEESPRRRRTAEFGAGNPMVRSQLYREALRCT